MLVYKKYTLIQNIIGDNMYVSIIIKTFILYFYIVLVYRLMGKKEVGKLSIIDLIVSILIAELAAMSIESTDRSIFISIVPILVLVIIQIVLSYISLKNEKIRKLIDGTPTTIIKEGKIKFNEMAKLRYGLDDLITQLREQGIKSVEEVDYAILENNGKLSVFQKTKDYPMPIIVDSKIDFEVLKELGKDIKWILNILENKNLTLNEVYYAFYSKNKTYIIKRDELI